MPSTSLTWKERLGVNILAHVVSLEMGVKDRDLSPAPRHRAHSTSSRFPCTTSLVLSRELSQHPAASNAVIRSQETWVRVHTNSLGFGGKSSATRGLGFHICTTKGVDKRIPEVSSRTSDLFKVPGKLLKKKNGSDHFGAGWKTPLNICLFGCGLV